MSRMTLIVVLGLTSSFCGCTPLSTQNWGLSAWRSKPESAAGDRTGDPWVQDTGEYTRLVHPTEEVADPLSLRKIFTSEKTREIERNLGVGP